MLNLTPTPCLQNAQHSTKTPHIIVSHRASLCQPHTLATYLFIGIYNILHPLPLLLSVWRPPHPYSHYRRHELHNVYLPRPRTFLTQSSPCCRYCFSSHAANITSNQMPWLLISSLFLTLTHQWLLSSTNYHSSSSVLTSPAWIARCVYTCTRTLFPSMYHHLKYGKSRPRYIALIAADIIIIFIFSFFPSRRSTNYIK